MPHRILLCDDELHILRAAEFKFKRAGYDVVCACDGEEGWERVVERQPDIVVTDCQMPRLNGLQLAQRIRSTPQTSEIPVIMLTGKGFELSPEELREQFGIRCLMAKPFSPRELFARVEAVLAGEEIELAPLALHP
ncbi:MAG TPA: response regulator [Pirellulaceae bacterium]|nr:response regulator [Pirellulaceae bacterium]